MQEDFSQYENAQELQIIDLQEGEGEVVSENANVTVFYRLYLTNGKVVQSNFESGQPFTSPLSNLVEGWQRGIPGMKVGGTRRLILPSELGYGEQGTGDIPGGATLVFDVKVTNVSQ